MRLKGKIAVVVGGGSGMGDATARLFAQEGASVIVADINEQAAGEVAQAIGDASPNAKAWAKMVDVTNEKSVQDLATFVAEQMGPADILVNTFGLAAFVPMVEMSCDDWQRAIDVNLRGTFLTCRAFGQQMIPRRRGKIVNFGSTASLSGVPGMVHYTAAKHGVLGLTRALAVEWGKYNIHVNCVCPGATATPLMFNATTEQWRAGRVKRIPLSRLGQPDEQARAALFLASDDSDYVTGAGLTTDGGVYAMAAATTDDALASQ
jgi:NAD(P)-dependent dehydrogenase (short-subunit alcohol dehydrogenase family)